MLANFFLCCYSLFINLFWTAMARFFFFFLHEVCDGVPAPPSWTLSHPFWVMRRSAGAAFTRWSSVGNNKMTADYRREAEETMMVGPLHPPHHCPLHDTMGEQSSALGRRLQHLPAGRSASADRSSVQLRDSTAPHRRRTIHVNDFLSEFLDRLIDLYCQCHTNNEIKSLLWSVQHSSI